MMHTPTFKRLITIALLIPTLAIAEDKVTIFAAASLTNAITEIAAAYQKEHASNVQTAFAASSALAKQIENGAPADIFISADSKWMNYVQDKNLINTESRQNLLGNQLVLIAPKGKNFKVSADKNFNFSGAFSGRLCTGETESVPAGIYAKQSLKNLSWWDSIKTRIVGTQDVRAALVFVERGECDTGIVYETDAKVSDKVETIFTFPDASHEPIVYPIAMIKNNNPDTIGFYRYLTSDKAKAVFARYGFSTSPVH